MSVTAQNIKDRAAEFASTPDATINLAIADATLQINRTNWGSKADLGTIYLAAHILKIWELQSTAGAGPVKKHKDGDLEIEFGFSLVAGQAPEIASLQSTTWGRMYMELRSQVFSIRVE